MSNRIELGVVLLAGGGVWVDDVVRQAQEAALKAAEAALEEQQRQALDEAGTKPTTEPPTRTVLGLLGGRAGGWFA